MAEVLSFDAGVDSRVAATVTVPCFALHGWGFGPSVWDDMLGVGPARPAWCQTLALPGYEANAATLAKGPGPDDPPPLHTLNSLAQHMLQRLPPEPVDLLGWSLGALVALQIAIDSPERVRRLVLLGATARFVADPDWPCAVAAETLTGFRADLARDPAALRARFALLCAQGEAGTEARQVVRRLRQLPDVPSPVLAEGLEVLASADLRATLRQVQTPVLLLHGSQDALMPLAAAEALAQLLPQAHLRMLPGAGHTLPLSAAADCAVAAQAFLSASLKVVHG